MRLCLQMNTFKTNFVLSNHFVSLSFTFPVFLYHLITFGEDLKVIHFQHKNWWAIKLLFYQSLLHFYAYCSFVFNIGFFTSNLCLCSVSKLVLLMFARRICKVSWRFKTPFDHLSLKAGEAYAIWNLHSWATTYGAYLFPMIDGHDRRKGSPAVKIS